MGRHDTVDTGPLARSLIDGYSFASGIASCSQEDRKCEIKDEIVDNDAADDENMEEDYLGSYVMDICSSKDEHMVAAVWSDFNIRLYNARHGLSETDMSVFCGHTDRINGLTFGDSETSKNLFSCGDDGLVATWDLTNGQIVQKFNDPSKSNDVVYSSIDVGCDNSLIVVGTEEEEESEIVFWDRRSSKVLGRYTESHTDGISKLLFNPSRKTEIASASMDGLICYFDITKSNEDDALVSVMNAGGPIRTIGYFGPQMECIYCLTHSETLALYHAEKAVTMAEFPMIRQQLGEQGVASDFLVDCCYVDGVGTRSKDQTLILVSGDHSGRMFLNDVTLAGTRKLCCVENKMAHCTDVRAVKFLRRDFQSGIPMRLLSGGEDGQICDWRHGMVNSSVVKASVGQAKKRKKNRGKRRPY